MASRPGQQTGGMVHTGGRYGLLLYITEITQVGDKRA
jgi:hypothetical protein